MDAAEITRLLDQAHPDGVTWETHVAFVERMAEWDVERILDFQESLFAHVVADAWVSTFDVPEVRLGEWMRFPVTLLERAIAERKALLEASVGLPPERRAGMAELRERLALELAQLEGMERPAIRRVEPEAGIVGVPVETASTLSMAKHYIARGGKPSRRRVVAWANDEGLGERSVHHILRAGAWAHRIKTGSAPKGFLPVRDEELHVSGELRRILVRHVIERGRERIETLWVWGAPNVEYLRARLPSIRPFTRVLDATAVGKPVLLDLRPDPGARDRGEGELIAEWRSVTEPPNSLLRDAREVLAGERRRRTTAAMADDDFWTLIELLRGDARRADAVVGALTTRPAAEIVGFAEALADKL